MCWLTHHIFFVDAPHLLHHPRTPFWVMSHIGKILVLHVHESCPTYTGVISHSHMCWRTFLAILTLFNGWWVMSHIYMGHFPHRHESCHAQTCHFALTHVLTHIYCSTNGHCSMDGESCMSHASQIHESCHPQTETAHHEWRGGHDYFLKRTTVICQITTPLG